MEQWYRHRDLRPMIVLPHGAGPDQLENHLDERRWVPRPGPAYVMVARIADLPASPADIEFAPLYLRCGFTGSHRYHSMMAP